MMGMLERNRKQRSNSFGFCPVWERLCLSAAEQALFEKCAKIPTRVSNYEHGHLTGCWLWLIPVDDAEGRA